MKNRFKAVLYFLWFSIVAIFLIATTPLWVIVWIVSGYNAMYLAFSVIDKADALDD